MRFHSASETVVESVPLVFSAFEFEPIDKRKYLLSSLTSGIGEFQLLSLSSNKAISIFRVSVDLYSYSAVSIIKRRVSHLNRQTINISSTMKKHIHLNLSFDLTTSILLSRRFFWQIELHFSKGFSVKLKTLGPFQAEEIIETKRVSVIGG